MWIYLSIIIIYTTHITYVYIWSGLMCNPSIFIMFSHFIIIYFNIWSIHILLIVFILWIDGWINCISINNALQFILLNLFYLLIWKFIALFRYVTWMYQIVNAECSQHSIWISQATINKSDSCTNSKKSNHKIYVYLKHIWNQILTVCLTSGQVVDLQDMRWGEPLLQEVLQCLRRLQAQLGHLTPTRWWFAGLWNV